MWNLELTELIAIFCTFILYFCNFLYSIYLDTGPLWIPAFVLKGPPCLNKVFFHFPFSIHQSVILVLVDSYHVDCFVVVFVAVGVGVGVGVAVLVLVLDLAVLLVVDYDLELAVELVFVGGAG